MPETAAAATPAATNEIPDTPPMDDDDCMCASAQPDTPPEVLLAVSGSRRGMQNKKNAKQPPYPPTKKACLEAYKDLLERSKRIGVVADDALDQLASLQASSSSCSAQPQEAPESDAMEMDEEVKEEIEEHDSFFCLNSGAGCVGLETSFLVRHRHPDLLEGDVYCLPCWQAYEEQAEQQGENLEHEMVEVNSTGKVVVTEPKAKPRAGRKPESKPKPKQRAARIFLIDHF